MSAWTRASTCARSDMSVQRRASGASSGPRSRDAAPVGPPPGSQASRQHAGEADPRQRRRHPALGVWRRGRSRSGSGDEARRPPAGGPRRLPACGRCRPRPVTDAGTGEQEPGIDVSGAGIGPADAQVQAGVGVVVTQDAQHPARADAIARGDSRLGDRQVRGAPGTAGDGDHRTAGDHAREGDAPGTRRAHRLTGSGDQVDPAVGAGGVGVAPGTKGPRELTADRIAPVRRRGQCRRRCGGHRSTHDGRDRTRREQDGTKEESHPVHAAPDDA